MLQERIQVYPIFWGDKTGKTSKGQEEITDSWEKIKRGR